MSASDRAPAIPLPRASELRAKTLGGPIAIHSPGPRYPTLSAGNEQLRQLLLAVLRRRGTNQAELAEDLRVPARLVSAWCAGSKNIPAAVFLAMQNSKFAEALLYATLDCRRANDNSEHR